MSMRITRKYLESRLRRLCITTRATLWLKTWSPGDGWTRYQIVDAGDQPQSLLLTASGMDDFLSGAIFVATSRVRS